MARSGRPAESLVRLPHVASACTMRVSSRCFAMSERRRWLRAGPGQVCVVSAGDAVSNRGIRATGFTVEDAMGLRRASGAAHRRVAGLEANGVERGEIVARADTPGLLLVTKVAGAGDSDAEQPVRAIARSKTSAVRRARVIHAGDRLARAADAALAAGAGAGAPAAVGIRPAPRAVAALLTVALACGRARVVRRTSSARSHAAVRAAHAARTLLLTHAAAADTAIIAAAIAVGAALRGAVIRAGLRQRTAAADPARRAVAGCSSAGGHGTRAT